MSEKDLWTLLLHCGVGVLSMMLIIWRALVHMHKNNEDITVAHVFDGMILIGGGFLLGGLMLLPMLMYFGAKASEWPLWSLKVLNRRAGNTDDRRPPPPEHLVNTSYERAPETGEARAARAVRVPVNGSESRNE